MKKHYPIIVLLSLFLCACSFATTEHKEATTAEKIIAVYPELETIIKSAEANGAEFIVEKSVPMLIYDGTRCPVALGAPEHLSSELSKMNYNDATSTISTYIDALRFFRIAHSTDSSYRLSPEECAKFIGDFKEVGIIDVFTDYKDHYSLMYIVQDNHYYVLDVANDMYGQNSWLDYSDAESNVCTSEDEMVNLVLNSHPDFISGKPALINISVLSTN